MLYQGTAIILARLSQDKCLFETFNWNSQTSHLLFSSSGFISVAKSTLNK